MRKIIIWLLPLILSGCDLEPETYEDCVLKKITPGMNEKVLQSVKNLCLTRTSEDSVDSEIPSSRPLPKDLYQYLTGNAGLRTTTEGYNLRGSETKLIGSIYNGIEGWTITGLEISFKYSNQDHFKRYRTSVEGHYLNPSSIGEFSVVVEDIPDEYQGSFNRPQFQWFISAVGGIKL